MTITDLVTKTPTRGVSPSVIGLFGALRDEG